MRVNHFPYLPESGNIGLFERERIDNGSIFKEEKLHGIWNDQDTARPQHGREDGNEQQASRSFPRSSRGDRGERDQEVRRIRGPGTWPFGEGAPQGAHRPQPPDRGRDQDQGEDRGEVPRRQGRERRYRSGEVDLTFMARFGPASAGPYYLPAAPMSCPKHNRYPLQSSISKSRHPYSWSQIGRAMRTPLALNSSCRASASLIQT